MLDACRRRGVLLATGVVALLSASASSGRGGGPDDPGWSGQWGLRAIGMPAVWRQADPKIHPVIAVVDTGARPSALDLRRALVPGWDFVKGDAVPRDTDGHGTNIAIIAAGRANNGFGLAGACPMCLIMPVRISPIGRASPSQIAAGIRWAADHGATIITISLVASGDPDADEQAAVSYATSRGAVVVAAAGNDGKMNPRYPAALDGVVAVAGADRNGVLYRWSTRGDWITLAAPGCQYVNRMCGTSYAPPVVAAALGALTAAHPGVTATRALAALRATARPVAGIGGGLIDVAAASRYLGAGAQKRAATARPTELTVFQGRFRRAFSTRLRVGSGNLLLKFTSNDVRQCSMELTSTDEPPVTAARVRATLQVTRRVNAGVLRISVFCTGPTSHSYTLAAYGVPPSSG